MKKLSKNAKKQLINILILLVLIGITLTVILTCNKELNFQTILNFIKSSNPWLLSTSVLCMLLGVIFEALSIYLISRQLGHKGKLLSAMVYSSADIYYSAITPSASGGQPAAAYYMHKDGMNVGTASFTLVFNVVAYTAAFLVLAVMAFAISPSMYGRFDFWPKFFIILGILIQALLLAFLIVCMFCHRIILKVGNWCISLLVKIKLVKKDEKWRKKLSDVVDKYRSCTHVFKKHKLLFLNALLLNVGQRVARVLIACCVCLAADPSSSFTEVFALQSFLIVGYTSIPLPGGTGIFEYLCYHMYEAVYADTAFVLSAMMVIRTVSFYISLIVCGAITLGYHFYLIRRKPRKVESGIAEAELPEEAEADIADESEYTEQPSDTQGISGAAEAEEQEEREEQQDDGENWEKV